MTVALAFAAFFLCFFSILFSRNLIIGDAADPLIEGLPMWLGRHTAWEPLTMLGFPATANPNLAAWYPLTALRFFPGPATIWYDLYHILAYWIAAMGTYLLIRGLTNSVMAGLIGGLIYALSGFMIGHAGHYMILHPAAWAPWVLWNLEQQILKPHPWRIAGGAGALALMTVSGQPQILVITVILAIILILWQAPQTRNARLAFFLRSTTTLYFGLALASVALFPALELALYSPRIHMSFDEFTGFTTPLLSLPFRLLFPYLMGGTTLAPYTLSGENLGSFAESSCYVGLLGLSLAFITIFSGCRHPKISFWVFVAASSLLLSTGNDLGLASITYHLPLVSWFRCPGRHAFEFGLAIAVLAGYAIARLEKRRVAPHLPIIVALGLGLSLAVLSIGLHIGGIHISAKISQGFHAPPIPHAVFEFTQNPALWIPCALCIPLMMVLLGYSRWPQSPMAKAFLLLAVTIDMSSFAWFSYWNTGAFPITRAIPPAYVNAIHAQTTRRFSRELTIPSADISDGIPPNLNILWHIPSLRGYSALHLRRTAQIYPIDTPENFAHFLAPTDQRLDAAAVQYLIVKNGNTPPSAEGRALQHDAEMLRHSPTHWLPIMSRGNDIVFKNRHPFPRAWTVTHLIPMTNAQAIAAVLHGQIDLKTTAGVEWRHPNEREALTSFGASQNSASLPPVQIRSLGPESMTLDASCPSRCFLVTSDVTYPGWQVRVDGVKTHLYPADATFRGVLLPVGHHHIDFQYYSWSRLLGWIMSMCSAMFIAGLVMSQLHLRRKQS